MLDLGEVAVDFLSIVIPVQAVRFDCFLFRRSGDLMRLRIAKLHVLAFRSFVDGEIFVELFWYAVVDEHFAVHTGIGPGTDGMLAVDPAVRRFFLRLVQVAKRP